LARGEILATLSGISKSNLSHNLSSSISKDPNNNATLLRYQIVSRSKNEAIVIGALATVPNYEDDTAETGFRMDDLTGGTALAKPSESLETDCVSFDIDATPKVDIIVSMDASGSMSEEQKQLSNFAGEFTKILNQATLAWRVGVTRVACSNCKDDSAVSQQFKKPWPSGSITDPAPCDMPIGGGFGGSANGELTGGGFTTKTSEISSRLQNVDDTNSEFALTMGLAAVDRALPRKNNSKTNIREDAAVIVVAVTDEQDELFSDELGNLDAKVNLSSSEKTTVANTAQPWVDYMTNNTVKNSKLNATAFGLYWPTGQQCSSAAQVAHGIHHVVKNTGGSAGSICQPNVSSALEDVANASAGLGSGLRLLGVPLAPTIELVHADVSDGPNGTVKKMPRSRDDGFDYQSFVNRISFHGPNPPETGDRVILPYYRWKESIKECEKKKDACPKKKQCVSGVCR
jgi:hypothetical protein